MRTLVAACVPIDLATITVPYVRASGAGGNYQEVRFKRTPSAKGWGSVHGLQMTIDYWDGVRLKGHFAGTFEFGNENGAKALGPLPVDEGRFAVELPRR